MRTTTKKTADAAKPEATDPVDAAALAGLTWATPATDVAPPIGLDELLQCLQLLATDEARAKGATFTGGTPASLQAIKSGALSSTKWASGLVAGVGGLTGAAAAAAGALGTFSDTAGTAETVALIGGAAVLLGAVAVALSIFVGTDLLARGLATAARHEGRAAVASAFLTATGGMPGSTGVPAVTHRALMSAVATAPDKVLVTTDALTDAAWRTVEMDSATGELVYVIRTPHREDRVKLPEIKSFRLKQ